MRSSGAIDDVGFREREEVRGGVRAGQGLTGMADSPIHKPNLDRRHLLNIQIKRDF